MRTKLLLILVFSVTLFSCSKSKSDGSCGATLSTAVAPASEIAAVQAYITNNNITATQHSSGLFYSISASGTGTVAPVACSAVTVKYVGKLTNGNEFDNSNQNYPNGITFALANLISGWQIGIPLIKSGGSIILYLPPSLGYGSQANPGIPANSILIFEIQLVNVQ
ncbi:MAG: FKBP-type peptidyl-prolyl cis-trans isomerase [Ferruginibacter sp.]